MKGLLDLHGGEMQIASSPGHGTCVTFHLPIDCERSRKRAIAAKVARLSPRAAQEPVDAPADKPADDRVKLSA